MTLIAIRHTRSMTTETAGRAASQDGLRERKKLRTRAALTDAAVDLFYAKGYEAVTIDELAAAVDVSPRTFFRYFASKEDVVLSRGAELDDLVVDGLACRPADEPPLTALRAALFGMLPSAGDNVGVGRFLRAQHLINNTPALLAGNLRRMVATEARLTAEIARRQGVDPVTDLRPRVLVGVVYAALRVALLTLCAEPRRDLDRLLDLVATSIDLATSGLPEQWGPDPSAW